MGSAYMSDLGGIAASAASSSTTKNNPKPGASIERSRFSPARAIELLLRHAAEQSEAALASKGKRPDLIAIATTLDDHLREAIELVRSGAISLAAADNDLSVPVDAVRAAVAHLVAPLSSVAPDLAATLPMTLTTLIGMLPQGAAGPARAAAPPAPLSRDDKIELCRQAIGAVRAHLGAMPEIGTGDDMREMFAAFAAPLELHLDAADSAARAVSERSARVKLVPDVELMSQQMDSLAEMLAMRPRVAWHRSFAAAFDAENELRKTIGLGLRNRPYSGHVDPKLAMKRISELADGQDVATEPDAADPNALAESILVVIGTIFEFQKNGVGALYRDLQRQDPPTGSIAEALVDAAIDVALMGAAGDLGLAASAALKPAFAKVANTTVKKALDEVLDQTARDMFKAGIKLAGDPPKTHSTDPLGAFVNAQEARLTEAKGNATLKSMGLSAVVRQAEVADLLALLDALAKTQKQAHDIQYAHALREWENLRARASADSTSSGAIGGGGADVLQPYVPGVIEIDLVYDPVHMVHVERVMLAGGESSAKEWLARANLPLGQTGFYERFHIRIAGSAYALTFGVDPRGQIDTLGSDALAILKILAAHEAVTPWNIRKALDGGYVQISDEAARALAGAIVLLAGGWTTSTWEGK